MRKLFGTDGIRGVANVYPMDAPTAYRVGLAVGHHFQQKEHKPRVLIGRDTRLSGTMLEGALTAGLCAVGAEAVSLGVISTPGVAHLTRTGTAVAGVMISASHNPFVDNGIKIFSNDGFKLPDDVELAIEKLILQENGEDLYVDPHEVGEATLFKDGLERYVSALVDTMGGRRLDGFKLVVDCANGAAFRIAPEVLTRLGASLDVLGVEPDGRNINQKAGSLHPGRLQEVVREKGASLGVAFDGDADRAIFVDERGEIVDGDQVMAVCAERLKQQGKLAKDTLVATVMSNIGLDRAMEARGIKLIKTKVGDRYVVECMRQDGYNFGGEQSGHLIFLDHGTSGDGILTALQVLSILVDAEKPMSELTSIMTVYPQVLQNLMVSYKRPLEELEETQKVISDIEKKLGAEGRVLVRYSGTENKVRVMVEGTENAQIKEFAGIIVAALDAELN